MTTTTWRSELELRIRDWDDEGRRLGAVSRGVGWWVGDWLRYGNARFGERYVRAARLTGYDVQTLMNMVYVTSRFDPSRRREELSFSHHAELAALEPAEQERWLSHASSERLSVRCLREELRRDRAPLSAVPSEALQAGPPAGELVCSECGCRFAGANPGRRIA
ncbi:MAG TPA: hypothetical protein VF520_10425 [Thermoleophilaceae bacterium]